MERYGKDAVVRLKKVIMSDKTNAQSNFLPVLKSDLKSVLSSYFDLSEGSPEVKFEVDEQGTYVITIRAEAGRIKGLKTI